MDSIIEGTDGIATYYGHGGLSYIIPCLIGSDSSSAECIRYVHANHAHRVGSTHGLGWDWSHFFVSTGFV